MANLCFAEEFRVIGNHGEVQRAPKLDSTKGIPILVVRLNTHRSSLRESIGVPG